MTPRLPPPLQLMKHLVDTKLHLERKLGTLNHTTLISCQDLKQRQVEPVEIAQDSLAILEDYKLMYPLCV